MAYKELKKLHTLIRATGEEAWKQDWLFDVSGRHIDSFTELSDQEQLKLCKWLKEVQDGLRAPKNPQSPILKTETNEQKANRLRRKVLSYAHDLKWYLRNTSGALVLVDKKAKLDMERINAFCVKSGHYHKELKDHSAEELSGDNGLIAQFKTMVRNTINK